MLSSCVAPGIRWSIAGWKDNAPAWSVNDDGSDGVDRSSEANSATGTRGNHTIPSTRLRVAGNVQKLTENELVLVVEGVVEILNNSLCDVVLEPSNGIELRIAKR